MKITAFGDHRVFESAFRAMTKNIRKEVRIALKKATELIAAQARKNAPVRTGQLKHSITVRSAPYTRGRVTNDLMWEVHVNCIYAGYQEFGTIHNPETRFLRDAVRDTRDEVKRIVRQAIADGIQETVETVGVKIGTGNLDALNLVDFS